MNYDPAICFHKLHTISQSFYVPVRMGPGIEMYIRDGVVPGGFLTAIITNNLKDAVQYADDENVGNIPAYVDYFYNVAPARCWGSEANMQRWCIEGGLRGRGLDYIKEK